jgi:hypothetical protein
MGAIVTRQDRRAARYATRPNLLPRLLAVGDNAAMEAEPPPLPTGPALKLSKDRSRTVCAFVAIENAFGLEKIITEGPGIGTGFQVED